MNSSVTGGKTKTMRKVMAVLAMAVMVAFAAPAFAATNPFMDVPQGHWSYDAVGLLASRGIVSGYPDGAFKGAQPATRYEMASVVARALVTVDAEKASKQDLDLLKKLVMEFKDELDALGVKVDSLDKRVSVLEDNLGGWKLSGRFYFDANFGGGDNNSYTESGLDNSFEKSQFRLYLSKQISETTSFYSEWRAGNGSGGDGTSGYGDIGHFNIREIYVNTLLPWDINMRVGRFIVDFEGDHGLFIDNEPIFGDYRVDGFEFTKSWDNFAAKAIIGRNTEYDIANAYDPAVDEYSAGFNYMNYALDLTWQPSEAFFVGVNGNWFVEDGDADTFTTEGTDFSTYSVYASYNFTPSVALQGTYYFQDIDEGLLNNPEYAMGIIGGPAARGYGNATEDNPQAWRVALDMTQDFLKFTSLRFEYMQQDNTFVSYRDPYQSGGTVDLAQGGTIAANMPWNDNTTSMFFIYAEQSWNDKWSSYLRYQHADFDTDNIDDADGYGIGVTYQYTPAIAFRLAYDYVDYGDYGPEYTGDDHVFQFRTAINF